MNVDQDVDSQRGSRAGRVWVSVYEVGVERWEWRGDVDAYLGVDLDGNLDLDEAVDSRRWKSS